MTVAKKCIRHRGPTTRHGALKRSDGTWGVWEVFECSRCGAESGRWSSLVRRAKSAREALVQYGEEIPDRSMPKAPAPAPTAPPVTNWPFPVSAHTEKPTRRKA
jgi:hypothetical protein